MSTRPIRDREIPAETVRVARATFPEGSVAIRLRNEGADPVRKSTVLIVDGTLVPPATTPWPDLWPQRVSGSPNLRVTGRETISLLGHGTQVVSGAGPPLLQCVDRG